MKEFRAVIENTAFWSELSIIASSKDEAEKMVEDVLHSDEWKKHEAEEQELGIADAQYRCGNIEEYGDALDSISGDLLLKDGRGAVALLKSGGNG
jgi:hypothetical protein